LTRRTLLTATAAGIAATTLSRAAESSEDQKPLKPPASGPVPVAFVVSDGAVLIDFAGPWEVFNNTITQDNKPAFRLYTVSNNTKMIASSGLNLIPDYTFANAPAPKVVVIPAQSDNQEMLSWIRKTAESADLTMSVCTGAFVLANTGLLAGKAATTHHGAYGRFGMQYKDIRLKRGFRFVEAGSNLASAGGLTSGIDLAMRVVERYYGRDTAERTAFYMEYQGTGWRDSSGAANQEYVKKTAIAGDLTDPVCGMSIPPATALKSTYQGTTYGFCSKTCKDRFDSDPASFLT